MVFLFSVNIGHEEQDDEDSWDAWMLDSDVTFDQSDNIMKPMMERMRMLSFTKREAWRVSMKMKTIRLAIYLDLCLMYAHARTSVIRTIFVY